MAVLVFFSDEGRYSLMIGRVTFVMSVVSPTCLNLVVWRYDFSGDSIPVCRERLQLQFKEVARFSFLVHALNPHVLVSNNDWNFVEFDAPNKNSSGDGHVLASFCDNKT